jgi:hypothetical protein
LEAIPTVPVERLHAACHGGADSVADNVFSLLQKACRSKRLLTKPQSRSRWQSPRKEFAEPLTRGKAGGVNNLSWNDCPTANSHATGPRPMVSGHLSRWCVAGWHQSRFFSRVVM